MQIEKYSSCFLNLCVNNLVYSFSMSPTKKTNDDEKMANQLVEAYKKIKQQVQQVIVGQDKVLEQLLIAMLARLLVCFLA